MFKNLAESQNETVYRKYSKLVRERHLQIASDNLL